MPRSTTTWTRTGASTGTDVPDLRERPPEEVIGIERVIATLPNAALLSAIQWLQLRTGSRANETRLLRLRDVTLPGPANEYQGHITVREDATKTAAGAREIPLDQRAAKAIRRYIADGRTPYRGDGLEPLFSPRMGGASAKAAGTSCTSDCAGHSSGAASADTSSTAIATPGHATRSRPACPRRRSCRCAAGASVDTLRRYHGKLSTSELARYPDDPFQDARR